MYSFDDFIVLLSSDCYCKVIEIFDVDCMWVCVGGRGPSAYPTSLCVKHYLLYFKHKCYVAISVVCILVKS